MSSQVEYRVSSIKLNLFIESTSLLIGWRLKTFITQGCDAACSAVLSSAQSHMAIGDRMVFCLYIIVIDKVWWFAFTLKLICFTQLKYNIKIHSALQLNEALKKNLLRGQ
jgi:hypothetical protein